jgi:hypothetical protein
MNDQTIAYLPVGPSAEEVEDLREAIVARRELRAALVKDDMSQNEYWERDREACFTIGFFFEKYNVVNGPYQEWTAASSALSELAHCIPEWTMVKGSRVPKDDVQQAMRDLEVAVERIDAFVLSSVDVDDFCARRGDVVDECEGEYPGA